MSLMSETERRRAWRGSRFRLPVMLLLGFCLAMFGGGYLNAQDEAEEAVAEEVMESGEETEAEDSMGAEEESAGEEEEAAEEVAYLSQDTANIIWLVLAGVLVFLMQAGFAMVETGLTRAKSACNIMMKNILDISLGAILYWAIGYSLMYGDNGSPYLAWDTAYLFLGHATAGNDNAESAGWFFQFVFAATAATIVSGAVAERTKLTSYIICSIVLTGVVYPISGSWIWGPNGWLSGMGMRDFAGSTVVHSVGAWAALAGVIVVGPRTGKYAPDGAARAIPGHNMPLAALGVFILFFGWFGFNPGSTLAAVDGIAHVAVTTALAGGAGVITALLTSWVQFGKPDLSMTLNGALAGLVGITAPCASVSTVAAVIIGAVAGVLVVCSVLFIDQKLRLDDPVGAISVHGVCGAWGTLAVGIFGRADIDVLYWDAETCIKDGLLAGGGISQIIPQLAGIGAVFVWAFGLAFVMFKLIDLTIGMRITPEEEAKGVDIAEHGNEAYPDFQIKSGLMG